MKASAEFENHVPFHNDHNVYILGAGFSYEAGFQDHVLNSPKQ